MGSNRLPEEEASEIAVAVLEDVFQDGLSPAEAVDYIAVEKADRSTVDWSDSRGITYSSVSGNVSKAKEKVNTEPFNMEDLSVDVVESEGRVVVRVTDAEGSQHDLPFSVFNQISN